MQFAMKIQILATGVAIAIRKVPAGKREGVASAGQGSMVSYVSQLHLDAKRASLPSASTKVPASGLTNAIVLNGQGTINRFLYAGITAKFYPTVLTMKPMEWSAFRRERAPMLAARTVESVARTGFVIATVP